MLSKEEKQQYARHLLLDEVGEENQERLKQSAVLVVGAGGLGCPVLQYLTAAGVGRIGIIDPDTVSISNLQRQILYTHTDVGKPKAEVAKNRLELLNPFIKIEHYIQSLNAENALSIFEKYDLIIEGSDDFGTKYLTNDACVLLGKPFVLGSIFKFEGQVLVGNYRGSATYRCLFPEPMSSAEMPTCSEVGVLGVLPGVIGTLMANEAIKILTGIGKVLAGKLLKIDLLSLDISIFPFEKDPTIKVRELKTINVSCSTADPIQEIDFETYKKEENQYILLDVRTFDERLSFHLGGIHIPLDELSSRWEEIPTEKSVIVYCATGKRSAKAIDFLKKNILGVDFLNLKGGVNAVES